MVDRQELVHRFQAEPACRVAVLSILAAGEGLSFTAASLCVFCELCPAVPGVIEQAEARIHRIGQKASHIDVHFLVVDGTRDDRVLTRLESRTDEVAQAIGGVPADAGPHLDLREHTRAVHPECVGSLVPISQRATTDVGPRLEKPRVRQMSAGASEVPAPRKKRRKPGFDLGSILGREIARAKADFAASSSCLHSDPAPTDLSDGHVTRTPELQGARARSTRVSSSEATDVPLGVEQAQELTGHMALVCFASGSTKGPVEGPGCC